MFVEDVGDANIIGDVGTVWREITDVGEPGDEGFAERTSEGKTRQGLSGREDKFSATLLAGVDFVGDEEPWVTSRGVNGSCELGCMRCSFSFSGMDMVERSPGALENCVVDEKTRSA
jgi:hypothetical protein